MLDENKEFNMKWMSALKEIENMHSLSEVDKATLRNLSSILYTYELIVEEMNTKTRRLQQISSNEAPNKVEALEYISQYCLSHQYELGMSIFCLAQQGYGNSISILNRSILENLINLSYLWLSEKINNSVLERNAWIEYYKAKFNSLHKGLTGFKKHREKRRDTVHTPSVDPSKIKNLQEREQNFREKYPDFKNGKHIFWCKHPYLSDRARKVDDTKVFKNFLEKFYLEELYRTVYAMASDITHGSSSIIDAYLSQNNKKEVMFGGDYTTMTNCLQRSVVSLLASIIVLCEIYDISHEKLVSQLHHLGYNVS
ncbi:hypothetical protein D1872_194100 [compost metagenome]